MTPEQESQKFDRIMTNMLLGNKSTDSELKFFIVYAGHLMDLYNNQTTPIFRAGRAYLRIMIGEAQGYINAREEISKLIYLK